MLIERRSAISGKVSTMDLPVTEDQIAAYNRGALIQHAFPHLSAEEREFFMTGITPSEWAEAFSEDEEEEG
jgi:hypothetical protein